MKPPQKLALIQIERRLQKLGEFSSQATIKTGWIRYMRRAMCMTIHILAKSAKLSPATIQQIEKRELQGAVTLQTMRKIAAAMNCEFIYALVPKEQLSEYLKKRATSKASQLIGKAEDHMILEDQKVNTEINERINHLAEELLAKGDIW